MAASAAHGDAAPTRAIATGVALGPMVAIQDAAPAEDADKAELEERVATLEKEAAASKGGHSIALVGGIGRSEYDSDFEPVDEVTMYWLDLVLGPSDGLGIEFGTAYGDEKDSGIDTYHVPISGGLRYTLGAGLFQPYVAGGFEAEYANFDPGGRFVRLREKSSWAYGPYVRAGINIAFSRESPFFFGADARYGLIGGEHDFGQLEPDADYVRYSAFVGFRF